MAKKKKGDERPFWTIDAETDPFKYLRVPKPFIWGMYTGAAFHTFDKTKDMVDAIKDQDIIVYAHNGGKFDFHFFLDEINLREEVKIISGRLVSAKIGRCEIRDSYTLLPEPLKSFGGKLDIDMRKLEPEVRHLHMPEITEYLKMDCVSLWDTIAQFERKYGRHLTQAGAAMALWEKISGRKAPSTDREYFHKFSQYYYGGRVQCFEKGYIKGPIGVWDMRSAYMSAMLDEHPYDPIYTELAYPKSIKPQDMVHLNCVSLGVLPHRSERGGIFYPDDNVSREYWVPGHEVLAGLETGSISKVEYVNAIRFANLIDFKPYIIPMYEGRKVDIANGEITEGLFKKRLGNSLYGKFGANPDNYGNYMCVPWDEKMDYEEEGYSFNGKVGELAVVRRDLDPWQQHFINVATAASITSQVRSKLWRGIHASTDPLYCDTDSIIARSATLPIGKELGEWAHEGTADKVWIAGKKMYYLQGHFEKGKKSKQATKGVRLEGKDIKKAATGHTVTAISDAPTFTLRGKRQVYFQKRNIRMTG